MKKKIFKHKELEEKWQEKWQEKAVYTPNLADNKKRKFYNLMMFPYPSAEGLHVGNMYAFSGADVYGRYKRMLGYDTFEPIGLDGFGIHSENYAIKVGRHPKKHSEISEEHFYNQLKKIGNGFAWDYRLETYDPEYYRWTQWLFIKLFEAGLAYRDTATVNWCPFDKTVLADEQVEDGKCERCGNDVERKEMSSWFFKITEYADRLLDNIEKIDWPEKIKTAQRQWIGRKSGVNITYSIKDTQKDITVFTTRPDTNFGATFVVVAPEYADKELSELIPDNQKEKVSEYIKKSLNKSEQERKIGEKTKTGVFTGLYAINNLNGRELPVYVADYVLMGFGTGAVVGVPGHDKRDYEFAEKFKLDVIRVVSVDGENSEITSIDQVQEDSGTMINSDFLDGLDIHEATEKVIKHIVDNGWGERVTSYHLRDWGISRQRYWGPPIPMINCKSCGWVSEKEENLPIILPDIEDFKPTGDGTSPLSNASDDWKYVACPKCGEKAERELEVSDTFLDSSWYFLAYINQKSKEFKDGPTPFNDDLTKRWFPVDAYIGGAEHAVLHLLYARFIWMVLSDLNLIPKELGDEPFPFLFGHGLIIKDGAKMSKSKGNVINPDEYIDKYGADALRTYLMFLGPYEGGGDFRDSGIEGMKKFIDKVYTLLLSKDLKINQNKSKDINIKLNKTIKKVTQDFANFKYNTAIASIMELVNLISDSIDTDGQDSEIISAEDLVSIYSKIAQLLAPLAPHMTEEVWSLLGNEGSIHLSEWPSYDEELTVDDIVNMIIQVNGKHRSTIEIDVITASDESKVVELALSDENINKWIDSKDVIKKKIFVPGKIINFVV